jgi:hypothetical protein
MSKKGPQVLLFGVSLNEAASVVSTWPKPTCLSSSWVYRLQAIDVSDIIEKTVGIFWRSVRRLVEWR